MINQFTGLIYDFRQYNCWDHVKNVRTKLAGLRTPDFDVSTPWDIDRVFSEGFENPKGLSIAGSPKDFDIVLMQFRVASKLKWHAGVYYQGMVSHCERVAKQVRLESIESIRKRYPRIEFWR